MIAKTIGFVHPPLDAFPSGGNVYNGKLLECANFCNFPLVSLPLAGKALPSGNWDMLIWDSLFLDRVRRLAGERVALLLHYLPSLDLSLEAGARQSLAIMEQRALKQADCVIATGVSVAQAVTANYPEKPVFLCEPGVGQEFLQHRREASEGVIQILTVAHLLPAKGHAQLLDILQELRHLPWHWHVVGDCDLAPETARRLHEHARVAALTGRITLHGTLPQEAIASLMARSDLLVAPSTFEAYGMAVAEAVAAGLPVVSNRVGAAETVIRHGKTGFLATVGDHRSFGGYLRVLLENEALRNVFRNNTRHAAVRPWESAFADFRAACTAMLANDWS